MMATPAEKRFVNAKLSFEEMLHAVHRWPWDHAVRVRFREVKENYHRAREVLRVERNGR